VTRPGNILRAYTGRLDGCLDFAFCRSIRMLCAYNPPLLGLGQFINQAANTRRFFGTDTMEPDFVLPAFIDNHDMNRFLWAAGDDKQRLRLALGLLFALGGPPVIYYGTEVGLSQPRAKGPHREESRHPMLWGEAQDRDLLVYVQTWAAARSRHPALGRGTLRTLVLDEAAGAWLGELAYADDKLLLAVNTGQSPAALSLPGGRYTAIAGGKSGGEAAPAVRSLTLPPLTVLCLAEV
jgi:glycosidase